MTSLNLIIAEIGEIGEGKMFLLQRVGIQGGGKKGFKGCEKCSKSVKIFKRHKNRQEV